MSERLNRDQIEAATLEQTLQTTAPLQPDPNHPRRIETDSEPVVRAALKTPAD
jgi:hypothetical protein